MTVLSPVDVELETPGPVLPFDRDDAHSRFTLRYWPGLDGLRGLAAGLVVLFHGGVTAVKGGFVGVDIFFVLSGFLVTALLLAELERTGSVNVRRFLLRRFLRLFPALLVLLAVCLTWASVAGGESLATRTREAVPLAAANVSNWSFSHRGPNSLGVLAHTWSLALEWQFYLLLPLLLLGLRRLRMTPAAMVVLFAAAVIAVASWRALLWAPGPDAAVRLYAGSDTRADAPLLGALIALLLHHGAWPRSWSARRAVQALGILGAMILAVAVSRSTIPDAHLYRRGGFILIALAAAAVVVSLVTCPPPVLGHLLRWRPLVELGKISYSLYLWHFPVVHLVERTQLGSLPRPTVVTLVVTLSVGAACLSYLFIERPVLGYISRLRTVGPVGAPRPVLRPPSLSPAGNSAT